MSEIGGMLPPWTEDDEARHQEMLAHIRDCTVCDWREDGEDVLCPAMRHFFTPSVLLTDPLPASAEMARAGAERLFANDDGSDF